MESDGRKFKIEGPKAETEQSMDVVWSEPTRFEPPIERLAEDGARMTEVRESLKQDQGFQVESSSDPSRPETAFSMGRVAGAPDKRPSRSFGGRLKKWVALSMAVLGIAGTNKLQAGGVDETGTTGTNAPSVEQSKGGVLKNYFNNLDVKQAFQKNKGGGGRVGPSGTFQTRDSRGNTVINYGSTTYHGGGVPATNFPGQRTPEMDVNSTNSTTGEKVESAILDPLGSLERVAGKTGVIDVSHPGMPYGGPGIEVNDLSSYQNYNLQVNVPGRPGGKRVEKTTTSRASRTVTKRAR